jgi:hypothetical protein
MKLETRYKKTKCIDGCKLFNDEKSYSYWENKKETLDEIEILNFINSNNSSNSSKILHIGIGNSYISSNLNKYSLINGISISSNEILFAKNLNIKNYNVFFKNKYEFNTFYNFSKYKYDIIIDANIKSFACCEKSFLHLMQQYFDILNFDGFIITNIRGMNWSRKIQPIIHFDFKNFFHRKLKEYDGPSSNLLTVGEFDSLSRKFGFTLTNLDKNIILLSKLQ